LKMTNEGKIILFVASLGEEARKKAFELLRTVREAGISADMDYLGRSLKAQMKLADRIGAKKVLIIGEDEIKKGCAILKDMKTGEQKEVFFSQIREELE
ncbi:MAG: histidine--tRNA ligase, partial [Candidatus Saganbacteria bacterium]|nr:histidine--tRNA ligase [Candidatus Saganbacteria bacterium]